MREGRDPHAEPVEGLQEFDVLADARRALQSQYERDLALFQGGVHLGSVMAEPDRVGVPGGETVGGLDHAQGPPQRPLGPELVVDEHGQHLYVHAAGHQLGQPLLAEERRPLIDGPGRHGAEQVVVGIGDDAAPVQVGGVARGVAGGAAGGCGHVRAPSGGAGSPVGGAGRSVPGRAVRSVFDGEDLPASGCS